MSYFSRHSFSQLITQRENFRVSSSFTVLLLVVWNLPEIFHFNFFGPPHTHTHTIVSGTGCEVPIVNFICCYIFSWVILTFSCSTHCSLLAVDVESKKKEKKKILFGSCLGGLMKNIHQSNDPWYGRALTVDDVTHWEFLVTCLTK